MQEIQTDRVYNLDLPFSLGIAHGNYLYLSGRTARDPDTGEPIDGVREQTVQIFEDITTILEETDTSLGSIVKTTVYITDMDEIDAVNDVYREYLTEPYPARSAVEVSDLAADFDVEIEVLAIK